VLKLKGGTVGRRVLTVTLLFAADRVVVAARARPFWPRMDPLGDQDEFSGSPVGPLGAAAAAEDGGPDAAECSDPPAELQPKRRRTELEDSGGLHIWICCLVDPSAAGGPAHEDVFTDVYRPSFGCCRPFAMALSDWSITRGDRVDMANEHLAEMVGKGEVFQNLEG
jgi:hypothetical protein